MEASRSSGSQGAPAARSRMNIAIVGHVDHGKSTVVGRLLADTNVLPEGKVEAVRHQCETRSRPFEYAFLVDALKDERSQGITIDSARVFFASDRRDYVLIDAPGHIEFLKNMVSGAARADAALLVIDAKEGVQENSRRHGHLLALLGIRQVGVLVNKMDLVGYREDVYREIVVGYTAFLEGLGLTPAAFIPVSGREGDNLVHPSSRTGFHEGPTVLDLLDGFSVSPPATSRPLRLPVQDVYRFTRHGDDRRIVAGRIETGVLEAGDEVVFYPSGKKSRVAQLEGFPRPDRTRAQAGDSIGFTLTEQVYVQRGEIATLGRDPPPLVGRRVSVVLFWLGDEPLEPEKDYIFRIGPHRTRATIEAIDTVTDAGRPDPALEDPRSVPRHGIARCRVKLRSPIAFDPADVCHTTARFVLVDDHQIQGGGLIESLLDDEVNWVQDKVILRNLKWEPSHVSRLARAERYNQIATLVLITGSADSPRKEVAKDLESALFQRGRFAYYLGIGSLKYGLDADLPDGPESRKEHFRRLGELAHILLDSGQILIVTAKDVTDHDVEILRATIGDNRLQTIWLGERHPRAATADLTLADGPSSSHVTRIRELLQDRGVIFRPR